MTQARSEASFWSHPDAVTYYSANRQSADELYPSEREFINKDLFALGSHLDVGCAAGGLAAVARQANPDVRFAGVDISSAMVETAQKRWPGYTFMVTDGARLNFPDSAYASVSCLGALHLTAFWKELLLEIWRVTASVAVFDLRLTAGNAITDPAVSYQSLSYTGADADERIPYLVYPPDDVADVLRGLFPRPYRLDVTGYMHPPSRASRVPLPEICMTMFRLCKQAVALGGKPLAGGIYWNAPLRPRRIW